MALQSSGAIKLSEIQTEFGGSNPISLSEYYDKGNAPASGEIQLAADFYGTSNAAEYVAGFSKNLGGNPLSTGYYGAGDDIIDISGSVQEGDLVLFYASSESGGSNNAMTFGGMTLTQAVYKSTGYMAQLLYYGTWQSGDSSPYVTDNAFGDPCGVLILIFRNASYSAHTTAYGTYGNPNPPSIAGSSSTKAIVEFGTWEESNTIYASTGFTNGPGTVAYQYPNYMYCRSGYQITDTSSAVDPGTMEHTSGYATGDWAAITVRLV